MNTQVNVYVEQRSLAADLVTLAVTLVRWFLYLCGAWFLVVLLIAVVSEGLWVPALLLGVLFPPVFLLVRQRRIRRQLQMQAYDKLREAKAEHYRQWREEMEYNRV